VLYPSFPIGQFVSWLQLSLNAEEYCTPLVCGCRNTRFYKYATPLGWRGLLFESQCDVVLVIAL